MSTLVITGSARQASLTRALGAAIAAAAEDGVLAPRLTSLPYYDQDRDGAPPASVVRFRQQVADADLLVVVTPETPFNLGSLALVAVCLLFGAIGEELLFRGYAFQLLAGRFGTFQVLLPLAVVFALMHAGNQGANKIGLFNTFLWGVLLGYALLRSGDLWLPIGLHFGWNVTTPLFGVNLSGFTMGLTGYTVQWKANELWSGGGYGPEGSVLCTLACFGVGYLLHRIPIVKQRLPLLPEED